jgi:ferredoxin
MVKILFDASRCDGYGMCSLVLPEHISLDRWGFAEVAPSPIRGTASIRRARRAVRCCPKQALSLQAESIPLGSQTG